MGNCQCPIVLTPPFVLDKPLDIVEGAEECCLDHASKEARVSVGRFSDSSTATHKEAVADAEGRFSGSSTVSGVDDSSDGEIQEEPKQMLRPRAGGVCAEPIYKGNYYKEPFWNKHGAWEQQLYASLSSCPVFRQFTSDELVKFVRAMEIHLRYDGEGLACENDPGDGLFVVLVGTINCKRGDQRLADKVQGDVIDEVSVLWSSPRSCELLAQGDCIVAKLCRSDYMNLCIRFEFGRREARQHMLRNAKLLEMMSDEGIAKLADVLQVRSYEKGAAIIKQGEEGREFFIMTLGEARVTVKTADDEQEYMRYKPGDLFGELALLKNAPRAATVTATTYVEVLVLHRRQFERLFGPMAQLHQQQYLTDPRKLIADFYDKSDSRGPRGSLRLKGQEPDPNLGESIWFAVYRPTSRDAIAKMLSATAVGKGLNVKGKSAKQGILSGFVPFVQISDNKHKKLIEKSPATARVTVYYRTKAARTEAHKILASTLSDCSLDVVVPRIELVDDYLPHVFGLSLPEPLLREAYIMRPDLSPVMGWETGRRSEPAFMDMNLHAIRDASDPKVVLYQNDESDAMNPRGLLIAYAEKFVKPVVSDFDTFTIGSRGMDYDQLPLEQAKLVSWALDQTEGILKTPNTIPWTSRWLEVLKREGEKGFHPKFPKFGFGDPTSYRLISDVVAETAPCGAVRHGAECCNFYFPQELDDEYLVVWHGFPDKPWLYKTEEQLRDFLMDRIQEGYSFPLNPVWPVRDHGWYEVLQALRQSNSAQTALKAWFPAEVRIMERIDHLRGQHPHGFKVEQEHQDKKT